MRRDDDFLFTPAVRKLELTAIVQILADIRDFLGVPPHCFFETIDAGNGVVIRGRITSMDLREGQQVNASVVLKTASGNPAAYEKGSAKWTSSDDSVVAVKQNPEDELKAVIAGLNGADNTPVLITFSCDGDPDAGPDQFRAIVATLDVVCTQGEAVVAEIQTDTPADSPVPVENATKKK